MRWIFRTANSLIKNIGAPELIDKDPLTKLAGLNTWHETRLLEEKIDNIQNLANASIEDLLINTSFYSGQLFNWVDQAVLFNHVGEIWIGYFRAVGINTATKLQPTFKQKIKILIQK